MGESVYFSDVAEYVIVRLVSVNLTHTFRLKHQTSTTKLEHYSLAGRVVEFYVSLSCIR